jgi:hypothetical protein
MGDCIFGFLWYIEKYFSVIKIIKLGLIIYSAKNGAVYKIYENICKNIWLGIYVDVFYMSYKNLKKLKFDRIRWMLILITSVDYCSVLFTLLS